MSATVKIAIYAKRKDGTTIMRNGKYVSTWKRVKPVARKGPWAVTPAPSTICDDMSNGYTVTHIPTGRSALRISVDKKSAVCALRMFAALPNQLAWSRIKNKAHVTADMKAQAVPILNKIHGAA